MNPAAREIRSAPTTGLRLKMNLLLLAIQAPAFAILAWSTNSGIENLVVGMARSDADRRMREVLRSVEESGDRDRLQWDLRFSLESTVGARAALFLADGNELKLEADWPPESQQKPSEDDYRVFQTSRAVEHVLEPDRPHLALFHHPFHNKEGETEGVLRLELDRTQDLVLLRGYQRQLVVGPLVVFVLTALVLFVGLHTLVVNPVRKLAAVMARTREGWLEPVSGGESGDEIGVLATSYNDMVHRLHGLVRNLRARDKEKDGLLCEVKELNESLRGKVEEATRSLAQSHKKLESAYHELYAAQREQQRLQGLASLGQMAREIAHEFSTPLNVISGTLQMLLEDRSLVEPHRNRLARVLSQTERLIAICRDRLTPLKMPAPKLQPSDLGALIREVVAFMAPALAARGVELRTHFSAKLPLVRADLHQLEQVLLNLVSNALDAMPSGGTIDVETRLEEKGSQPFVVLSVRDSGVGIPPDHLARIFEPFFSTKGAGRGTGLGLAICKDIVTGHGGEISMDSSPGMGSCAIVRLPAAALERPSHHPGKAA